MRQRQFLIVPTLWLLLASFITVADSTNDLQFLIYMQGSQTARWSINWQSIPEGNLTGRFALSMAPNAIATPMRGN
jgi:hypothetical protein